LPPQSVYSLPRSPQFILFLEEPRVSPLPATLTGTSQFIENTATLSPLAATLTSHVNHKSFVCHSYKNTGGWGHMFQARLFSMPSASKSTRSLPIPIHLPQVPPLTYLESTLVRNPEGYPGYY